MEKITEQGITPEQREMIEKFQCPGCTCGYKTTDCESFRFEEWHGTGCQCKSHSAGTFISGVGKIAIGLPRGFDHVGTIKTGFESENNETHRSTNIRLIIDPSKKSKYDHLNVPVWAIEGDGYLFVRVISPRINYTYVDIIKGGKFNEICPNAINVAEFVDEID
jgi:hypothetical protein